MLTQRLLVGITRQTLRRSLYGSPALALAPLRGRHSRWAERAWTVESDRWIHACMGRRTWLARRGAACTVLSSSCLPENQQRPSCSRRGGSGGDNLLKKQHQPTGAAPSAPGSTGPRLVACSGRGSGTPSREGWGGRLLGAKLDNCFWASTALINVLSLSIISYSRICEILYGHMPSALPWYL